MITQHDLENWFTHHPPQDEETVKKYQEIRQMGYNLADTILRLTPPSADQTAAIRKVREAVATANMSIACDENTIKPFRAPHDISDPELR